MSKRFSALSIVGLCAVLSAGHASASVVINLTDELEGLTASAYGSLDLSGETPINQGGSNLARLFHLSTLDYYVSLGEMAENAPRKSYFAENLPSIPGPRRGNANAISSSGTFLWLAGSGGNILANGRISVPADYVWGEEIDSKSVWGRGVSVANYFENGRYVFELPGDQTVTLNIGNAFAQPAPETPAVPLPAGVWLLGSAAGLLALNRRRQRKS